MKKRIFKLLPLFIMMFSLIIWPASENQKASAGIPIIDDAQQSAILTNETIQTDVLITMESMQAEMTAMQKGIDLASKSAEFVKNAKIVIQFGRLIESMICVQHNLRMLQRSKGMNYCSVQLQFQIAMMDLTGAKDIMTMVLKGGLSMDQGQRIQNVKNAMDLLQRANTMLIKINYLLSAIEYRTTLNRSHYQDIQVFTSYQRR